MLEVCEKAYRLYVVTYKICQMFQISCYRLVLQLKFIVTVDVLYDQEESDFVLQCQTKMLYGAWSSLQPDHETNKSKSALQPGTMTGRRSETFEDLISLPRISTKDFPFIRGKID